MKKTFIFEPSYLTEAFLSNYFLADVLFSQFCSQEELNCIYNKYADIFCIKNKIWLNEIWDVISSDLFSLADNTSDFNRLVRLAKQFPDKMSSIENYLLSHKAIAIQIKSDILLDNDDMSFDSIIGILEQRANGGNTDCISLLGFLEQNGIFINQNTDHAEKLIAASASWNHLFGILMGLHYSKLKDHYSQKICTLLRKPSNESTLEYLYECLDISSESKTDKIALALEYAFSQGTLQENKINDNVIKLIHSSVINESAKAKLIKSINNKDSYFSDIPLGIVKNSELIFNENYLSNFENERKTEVEQITSNLSMINLRGKSVYKPLLFVCEDEMLLDYYRDAIKQCFAGSPISHIRLHEGDNCNLSNSVDNIFISSMDKYGEKNAVVLLDHCEVLNEEGSFALSKLLNGVNRKHYKLSSTPSIEIDMSGVLPILFASGIPDACITEYCDILFAKELTKDEFKSELIKSLENKRDMFRLSTITLESKVTDFLFDYSSSTVSTLINKAICQLKKSSSDILITVPILQAIIDKFYSSKSKTNFWRDSRV